MFGLLREPRILTGIALMLVATVLGAVTLQRASARISVWQLDHTVAVGTALQASDVHLAEVAGDVDAYATSDSAVIGKVVNRTLATGELLPKAAFGGRRADVDEVMVPATALHMPDALQRGELVDVWLSTTEPDRTIRVLAEVRVVRTIAADVGGGRGVALAVPPDHTAALVAAIRQGEVDLVRVAR